MVTFIYWWCFLWFNMELDIGDMVQKLLDLDVNQQAVVSKRPSGLYVVDVLDNQDNDDLPYVMLKVVPSSREYGILHVTKETRGLFPGYKRQFVLETTVQPFVMHLTGADNGTHVGEDQGGYICHPRTTEIDERFVDVPYATHAVDGSFKRFFDANPRLRPETLVTVYRVNNARYRLEL